MQQRTWDYGTTKAAQVLAVDGKVIALVDDVGEGHVLVGADHDVKPSKGNDVTMMFAQGGPTGGYWKIISIDHTVQVGGLNWYEDSGSWYEQWLHVKNACELSVVRDKAKNTWMAQYATSVMDIHLLGWFIGDRDDALAYFSRRIPVTT